MPEPVAIAEPDWRARIRGSRLGNLTVLAVTALAVLIGSWLVMRPGDEAAPVAVSKVDVPGAAAAPVVGDQAPGFTATDLNGASVSLDGLRGRPVWLVFMATWCTGCRAEVPDVQGFHEQSGDEVEVIAVYVGEPATAVQPFADRLGLSFTQLPDGQTTLSSAYGVMGVPAHFFLDSAGVVQETRIGVLSPDQIDQAVAKVTV